MRLPVPMGLAYVVLSDPMLLAAMPIAVRWSIAVPVYAFAIGSRLPFVENQRPADG